MELGFTVDAAADYEHSESTEYQSSYTVQHDYEKGKGIIYGIFLNYGFTKSFEFGFAGKMSFFDCTSFYDFSSIFKYNFLSEQSDMFDLTIVCGLDFHSVPSYFNSIGTIWTKVFDPMVGLLGGISLFDGKINFSAGVQNFCSLFRVYPSAHKDLLVNTWKYEPYLITSASFLARIFKITLSFNYNLYGNSLEYSYIEDEDILFMAENFITEDEDAAYIEIKPVKYFFTVAISFVFYTSSSSEDEEY